MLAPAHFSLDGPAQVLTALVPVLFLASAGWGVARLKLLQAATVKELSNLVFYLFLPALLFRAMAKADFGSLDWAPIVVYFGVALFTWWMMVWRGAYTPQAVVQGLASVFSNTGMIGVPIITLAYPNGLVTLLMIISVHAMILLTVNTIAMETALQHERHDESSQAKQHMWQTAARAARSSLLHPVPIPIFAGLLWSWSGWSMPGVMDEPLKLLGGAFSPMALVMLGASTYLQASGLPWKPVFQPILVKLIAFPALVATVAWVLGISGVTLAVLTVTAALPAGANVFIFAQRYGRASDDASMCVSGGTVVSVITLSVWMTLTAWWLS